MHETNIWIRAKQVNIKTIPTIIGEFDIGFDNKIPADTQNQLRAFVKWVEKNFNIPITLWVDFEHKHYLIDRSGKRVGFLFYWSDFVAYPTFEDRKNIPLIRLPVRTEHSTMDEILTSFIEAITCYFAWIMNIIDDAYAPAEEDVEEILQAYLASKP